MPKPKNALSPLTALEISTAGNVHSKLPSSTPMFILSVRFNTYSAPELKVIGVCFGPALPESIPGNTSGVWPAALIAKV